MQSSVQGLSGNDEAGLGDGTISFWKSMWGGARNAVLGTFAAVLFGLAVLLMSIFSVTAPQAAEREAGAVVEAVEPATAAPTQEPQYYLPYPGLLPDNPLYILKAVRDRIRLWLTFDEVRKAELELLYADKRMGAADILAGGGKPGIAVSTATKGVKYLESSANRVIKLGRGGKDVKAALGVLVNAAAKHAEILKNLEKRTSGAEEEAVRAAGSLAKSLSERVQQELREAR